MTFNTNAKTPIYTIIIAIHAFEDQGVLPWQCIFPLSVAMECGGSSGDVIDPHRYSIIFFFFTLLSYEVYED